MNLAIITPAYYADDTPFKLLKESCATFHLPLRPFGLGRGFPGDMVAHFTDAAETIRNLPVIYDLVMFTDSYDAFVVGGAEEIERKWQKTNGILVSAEMELFPQSLNAVWYRQTPDWWGYPNGGGWIGRREKLQSTLRWLSERYRDESEAQVSWVKAYLSDDYDIYLDHSCSIFQTMSGGSDQHLEIKGSRIVNKMTGSQPAVIHFNGRSGENGVMEEWYRRVYGR